LEEWLCLWQARLQEVEGVAVENCRVSEGITQPPRLHRNRRIDLQHFPHFSPGVGQAAKAHVGDRQEQGESPPAERDAVRLGSLADIGARSWHLHFTLPSRHAQRRESSSARRFHPSRMLLRRVLLRVLLLRWGEMATFTPEGSQRLDGWL
jgi:hypothetical protein